MQRRTLPHGIAVAAIWCLFQDNKADPIPSIGKYCEAHDITLRTGKEHLFVTSLQQYVPTDDFTYLLIDCLDFGNAKYPPDEVFARSMDLTTNYRKTIRLGL